MRNPSQQKTEQQQKIMDAFDRAALPAQTYPIKADSPRPSHGQRKAAQIGKAIGVLVQDEYGSVAAVTDMGRVTWLPHDVVAPPEQEQTQ